MKRWRSFLGVRLHATRTVWLFFLHACLLNTGTLLLYMVATIMLLETSPERNLPIAYGIAGLASLGVGRRYAYWQQHLLLQTLATRTLLVVFTLVLLLSAELVMGPSMAVAIAIMIGYRLISLLTDLAFWGLSAAVFDARQSRRLFGIISAGDMPAKVLGAGLALLVYEYANLFALLLLAAGIHCVAVLIQHQLFRLHPMNASLGLPRPAALPDVLQTDSSVPLIRSMGLGVVALVAVGAGVEYLFLLTVKGELQFPTAMLQYISGVLAITYSLASILKLLLTRRGVTLLSLRWALLLLPLSALTSFVLLSVLQATGMQFAGPLVYVCVLCLGLEVLRRTVFEPAFQVLFQPLTLSERLRGHTLIKGLYEPLGLGIASLLLLSFAPTSPYNYWIFLGWIGLLLIVAIILLQNSYQHYLRALKGALGWRSTITPSPTLVDLTSEATMINSPPEGVRNVLDYLRKSSIAEINQQASSLLSHPNSRIRHRILTILGKQLDTALLRQLALNDLDPMLREAASRLASHSLHLTELLLQPDLAITKGAIRGRLEMDPADALARNSLLQLAAGTTLEQRLATLDLIAFLGSTQQVDVVVAGLRSTTPALVKAAVRAVDAIPVHVLGQPLVQLLGDKVVRKSAADGLARWGAAAIPALAEAFSQETDTRLMHQHAQVCARLPMPASRQLLLRVAQGQHLFRRAAALRALRNFALDPTDAPLFRHLMEEEMLFAQHLLHGMEAATIDLHTALQYELHQGRQRLVDLLMQLHERQPILDAQRSLGHSTPERQARALEALETLLPRPLYHSLQALLNESTLHEKIHLFDALLGPTVVTEAIGTTVVRRGAAAFSPWTISVALQHWHPQPATVAYLYPHLQAPTPLIRESALALLRRLPVQRPAAYDQLMALHPGLSAVPASPVTSRFSARDRVLMLKSTPLFAETPENALSMLEPVLQEVTFEANEELFAKGVLGTSLFIVAEGEVGIFDGLRQLTHVSPGDFFGELALLDAEPRSATAVAQGTVVAFRLDQNDFYDVIEECPEVLRKVMRALCQRLRRQNESSQRATAVAG